MWRYRQDMCAHKLMEVFRWALRGTCTLNLSMSMWQAAWVPAGLDAVDSLRLKASVDSSSSHSPGRHITLWPCSLWLGRDHPINVYFIKLNYSNPKLLDLYPNSPLHWKDNVQCFKIKNRKEAHNLPLLLLIATIRPWISIELAQNHCQCHSIFLKNYLSITVDIQYYNKFQVSTLTVRHLYTLPSDHQYHFILSQEPWRQGEEARSSPGVPSRLPASILTPIITHK